MEPAQDSRIAEARVRQHPLGPELVFYVNVTLLWAEVFKTDRAHLLGELADEKRREFEERGWRG